MPPPTPGSVVPRRLLALVVVLALAAPLAGTAQPLPARPLDRLLLRPDLQRLVDLQTHRDGEGLRRALHSRDAAVRARAAFALASVQDAAAIPDLLALLRDPAPQVRADAAFALGQSPGPVPADTLLARLAAERDPSARALLLEALGKQGDEASLRRVASLPTDPALDAALALTIGRYALRDVHADEAVDRLLALLQDAEPAVRRNAAYYFARSRATAPWAAAADEVRARLDAMPPGDPAAMHLVLGLGRLRQPEDTPRLLHWLNEATDWRTRTNAARALAPRTDDVAVRATLFARLDDPSGHVALVAAEVLSGAAAWTGAETAAVQRWIEAHPAGHRAAALLLRGLAAQGAGRFVLAEVERLRSLDAAAYARSLSALAAVSDPEAFTRLEREATSSDRRLAYRALSALADRWSRERTGPARVEDYFALFSQALRRRDLAAAYVAAPLLADSLFGPLAGTRVLQEVYRTMRSPEEIEPMTAILGALGASGDAGAVPLLREAAAHPHPVVRRAAADALTQLTGTGPALPEGHEPPERTVDWLALTARGPAPRLVLQTEKGTVTLALATEEAPLTVQTILDLAEQGTYDGVPFHRVVPNFVIQGGDFERGDGFGGPGFSIRSEFTRVPYGRGTVGMASAGKDTEGSQYFVTHSMQPHLDGRYTAFGTVTDGMEVVDRIEEGDRVLRARVLNDQYAY